MARTRRVASIYARGNRLWGRLKNEAGKWVSVPTDYNVGQEDLARREMTEAQRRIDRRKAPDPGGPPTVTRYATAWLEQRKKMDLAAIRDDIGRINNHVLPVLGDTLMHAVTPLQIRDFIRDLRRGEMAPRTVRNTYGIMRTMFHDAHVEGVIDKNPCIVARGELPGKHDNDSEWRAAATYARAEVEQLISDERIPPPRRIQYALKALAGLRHGEVAGLRWRHYDSDLEPLGRLVIATSYDTRRTKTGITRRVPVHLVLAALLLEWRLGGWAAQYGRSPELDDLVVPTKNMTPVAAADAGHAMHADLGALKLRQMAGDRRRGGHDLRAWFITSCQEGGAHRDLLRVVTHTAASDVVSGYTRATWAALCAEVAKLQVGRSPRDTK